LMAAWAAEQKATTDGGANGTRPAGQDSHQAAGERTRSGPCSPGERTAPRGRLACGPSRLCAAQWALGVTAAVALALVRRGPVGWASSARSPRLLSDACWPHRGFGLRLWHVHWPFRRCTRRESDQKVIGRADEQVRGAPGGLAFAARDGGPSASGPSCGLSGTSVRLWFWDIRGRAKDKDGLADRWNVCGFLTSRGDPWSYGNAARGVTGWWKPATLLSAAPAKILRCRSYRRFPSSQHGAAGGWPEGRLAL